MSHLGLHAAFIVLSYAIAAFIIAALVAWVFMDYAVQKKILEEFDARDVSRRSDPPHSRPAPETA